MDITLLRAWLEDKAQLTDVAESIDIPAETFNEFVMFNGIMELPYQEVINALVFFLIEQKTLQSMPDTRREIQKLKAQILYLDKKLKEHLEREVREHKHNKEPISTRIKEVDL